MGEGLGSSGYRTTWALSDNQTPPAVWTFLATLWGPFSLPTLSGQLKPLEGSRTFGCHAFCKGKSGPVCYSPLPRGWLKRAWGPCNCPVCCVTPRRKVPGGRRPFAGRLFPQPAKVRSGGFPALSTGLTLVLGAPLLAHAAQTRVRTETPELGPLVGRWAWG